MKTNKQTNTQKRNEGTETRMDEDEASTVHATNERTNVDASGCGERGNKILCTGRTKKQAARTGGQGQAGRHAADIKERAHERGGKRKSGRRKRGRGGRRKARKKREVGLHRRREEGGASPDG
jgi:hypothetical protein